MKTLSEWVRANVVELASWNRYSQSLDLIKPMHKSRRSTLRQGFRRSLNILITYLVWSLAFPAFLSWPTDASIHYNAHSSLPPCRPAALLPHSRFPLRPATSKLAPPLTYLPLLSWLCATHPPLAIDFASRRERSWTLHP